MKNLYSFFYLKKIIRLKHSQHFSLVLSTKEKNKKKKVALAVVAARDRLAQLSTKKLCWKNVLLNVFTNKVKKTILQKVNLYFQKNTNKKTDVLKKKFSNQCKKNIQSIHSLKKKLNSKFTCWFHLAFIKISTKFFLLNKQNLNQICRNIPIKIEKIFNISNIFTNFYEILLSIFTKWQKIFIFFLAEQVFLLIEKKLFCSNNINRKQEIKNYFYLLQKKYLKKKSKFAIFLFQIFFKNIQKSFKRIFTKFFLNANFFQKNLNFLFLQLFLELQFSFFLILKNFQNFLIEQNVLQIFLKKQYLKKKKEIFSFFFQNVFLPQVNYKKTKTFDFLFFFDLQNFFVVNNKNYFVKNKKNFNFDIYQKVFKLFLLPQKAVLQESSFLVKSKKFISRSGKAGKASKASERSPIQQNLIMFNSLLKTTKLCWTDCQFLPALLPSGTKQALLALPRLGQLGKLGKLGRQKSTSSVIPIKGKLKKVGKMKFLEQSLKNKIKVLKKKNLFLYKNKKLISSKKQTKKLFYFKIWKFLWKNLPKLINKKNLKLLYKLNIQNKQKTKLCFLFSHNILKLGKIFSIFFYFTKTDFCKTFAKKNFFCNFKKNFWHRATFRQTNFSTSNLEQRFMSTCQSSIDFTTHCQTARFYRRKVALSSLKQSFQDNRCKNHNTFQENLNIDYGTKSEKNYFLARINKKFSNIFSPQTHQKNFSSTTKLWRVVCPACPACLRLAGPAGPAEPEKLAQSFSFNQMFYLNKNSVLNKTQKKILYRFLKFIKKNIQIFFEYFCVLNCLKTHIEFFPNGNDFQILSHQQLKFSFFRFQQKNKNNMKFCMQSLIYSDYLTFFSFLQVFPIRNIQKYKNYYFLNIFSIFINLYSIKKIENMYKIDQIYLLNNLNKTFCETKIQKFFKFLQKKVAHLKKKAFYSQKKQTNVSLTNQIIIFDESIVLFKFFFCYFEKILFHLYKTCKLQQIKIYFSKKSYFVSFFNFSCFQNFYIKNKCFKNSIFEPIHFIYKYYYENFLFFYSMIYLFINNQKFLKLINIYFHKYQIFNKWFFNNFKNIQICTQNFVFRNIPSIDLFQIFSLNISKKQKETIHLLHFHKMFWLLSKKNLLKSTKLYKKYFFSFSAFFSSFFIQKSQNDISYLQKKVRKNVFIVKNYFHLNFEGYFVSFFIWKKNSQIFFVFQKNKTLQNIQIHLKQCQQIIKNSIGKKQLFFMKKLQRKMKIWCQEYKNNVYNCQLNSTLAKFSAKKTFHYCDSMLLKYLWNWARKTHPNKNKLWIKKKYFHFIHSKKWFFGKKVGKVFICLPLHSQTKI